MNKTKTPPIYRVYYFLRNLLTPNQNLIYLIIESILIGVIISTVIYNYNSEIIPVISILLSFSSISIIHYFWTKPEDRKKEYKSLNIDFKKFSILTIISIIPLSLLYIYSTTYTLIILTTIIILYTYTLYSRSKKYIEERSYYTSPKSEISDKWYYASLYIERGIEHLDKENNFRAYYWSYKAEKEYEDITEREERHFINKGAGELKGVAELITEAIFLDKREQSAYIDAINKSFEASYDYFTRRFCDECNQHKHISDVYSTFIDGEHKVFCEKCYNSNGEQDNKNKEKYSKSSNNSRTNNTQKNKHTVSMSIKEACSKLDIEKPLTESKINEAYKDSVKKTHPDVGGSVEEFKETEKAKEILMDEV